MARARSHLETTTPLYERDYALWVEQQASLLREGDLDRLDRENLVEEIDDLGRNLKNAVASNLVVVLKHLLKHQFQPRRSSRSWLGPIEEHRRRLRRDLQSSPSLRTCAQNEFDECYCDACRQAIIEAGLADAAVPQASPYTLDQALDPDFLPG